MATPDAPTPRRNPMSPRLTDSQRADLAAYLDNKLEGRTGSPAEILVETESWAMAQDDPAINQWLWQQQADANSVTRTTATTTGFALRDHLNSINARDLSFRQASHLGVELVHHGDSDRNQIFHTADGDIVCFSDDTQAWDIVENGRNGIPVMSGDMGRKHLAYQSTDALIHPTAQVAGSATIERGARIGPHVTVGEHAHVGVDSTIASYARVEDGAFVGAYSSVRDGSRIGPGAVVGTGSDIGSTTNVGSGARLEQSTSVEAFDNVAANSHVGGSTESRKSNAGLRPGQVSSLVDRLAQLDRD